MNKKKIILLSTILAVVYILLHVIAKLYGFSTVNSLYAAISLFILFGIIDILLISVAKVIRKKCLGVAILLYFFAAVWSITSIVYLLFMIFMYAYTGIHTL